MPCWCPCGATVSSCPQWTVHWSGLLDANSKCSTVFVVFFVLFFYLGMVLLYCHWFWYHSHVEKLAVATQMLSM